MRKLVHRILLLVGFIALALPAVSSPVEATGQTVGLFLNEEASFDGYTLSAPLRSDITYLIDNDGRLVNSWDSAYTPLSAYLLEDGSLLRTARLGTNPRFTGGGNTGRVERFAWDGTLVWEFEYSSNDYLLHHDIETLPNGNVLMIAWEYKTDTEAIAAGRNPDLLGDGELWPEKIIEVEPTGASGGNIVWEWHVWDHLIQDFDPEKDNSGVVANHPELIDINFTLSPTGRADWQHANGIDYNPALDQIVLSLRSFSEIWVIDHSTTTEEAETHLGGTSEKGGDLLYRWGNPQVYRAGDAVDKKLFSQHDAQWIEPGLAGEENILVFNNGTGRPGGDYSSVDELVPPVDSLGNYSLTPSQAYGPVEPTWTYVAPNPTDFYAAFISGAQRLPNGNTLIDDGTHGAFFEVTSAGETVWKYVNPVTSEGPLTQGASIPALNEFFLANAVFRAYRYAPDFPGLAGKDLMPGDPIEIIPIEMTVDTDGDGLSDWAEDKHGTNPLLGDTDLDGCGDGQELGTDERLGGRRNPLNPWDFYDVSGDKVVNLFDDIIPIAFAFGSAPGPPYVEPYDRSAPPSAAQEPDPTKREPWDMGPPDGAINILDDVFGVVAQFGHDCRAAP